MICNIVGGMYVLRRNWIRVQQDTTRTEGGNIKEYPYERISSSGRKVFFKMYQKGKDFLKDGVIKKKDRLNDFHSAGTNVGVLTSPEPANT